MCSIFNAQFAHDIPVTLNTNSFFTEPSPENDVVRNRNTTLMTGCRDGKLLHHIGYTILEITL